MEEDRLLHALRDLEKTGAKQQQAIGKLYKGRIFFYILLLYKVYL